MKQKPVDIVIACCRDEEDIIAEFIHFYFDMGFDYVCLIDNGSQDRTMFQILRHSMRDRINVISDPRPGYDKRLLTYHNHFAPLATRWIFFIDVDEFIYFPRGIKEFTETISDEITVLQLPVAEMLPNFSAQEGRAPLLTMHREAAFQKDYKFVWKQGQVDKIYCGKHRVERHPYRVHQPSDIFIRHYHTRSRYQFRKKLHNRIETHLALSLQEQESLSAYPPSVADKWITDSQQLLEPGGWETELARIDNTPWVEDNVIRQWYIKHLENELPRSFSPLIKIELNSIPFYCFSIRSFLSSEGHTAEEHLILIYAPDLTSLTLVPNVFMDWQNTPIRIHSECLFGDVFSSSHCDCAQQLNDSLKYIKKYGRGILFYLRQEGRGIGLFDKIRSLTVTHQDSFYRNESLGMPGDGRDYSLVAQTLHYLGIDQVQLISGNPAKLESLQQNGISATLTPMTIQDNLSDSARNEVQSKIRRGYQYLMNVQDEGYQ